MNISDLKVLADKLSVIEERRRLALGASGVGIWDWNIETNQLIWDEAMFLIYDITEDSFNKDYKSWTDLVHPEDVGQTNDAIQRCLSHKGGPYSFKFRVRRGACWRVVSAFGNCVRNKDGTPKRMVGINILEPDFCEDHCTRAYDDDPCATCPMRIAKILTSISEDYLKQSRQRLIQR